MENITSNAKDRLIHNGKWLLFVFFLCTCMVISFSIAYSKPVKETIYAINIQAIKYDGYFIDQRMHQQIIESLNQK